MKFIYVDETGDSSQSDIFVMAGLLIDAYRLRKYAAEFDGLITEFLKKHPSGKARELKTKSFLNGTDKWSKVPADERKKFITDVCDIARECARIYPIALSLSEFSAHCKSGEHKQPFGRSYWLGAALLIASLVQQKMLKEEKNKGLTVFIADDNKGEMSNFSEMIYDASDWFDPLYQGSKKKKNGDKEPIPVPDEERFSLIVDTAFAIKSEHSSLVQAADAVAYVYRRHIELKSEDEAWDGEREYFDGLAAKLDGIENGSDIVPGRASIFTGR